MKVTTERVNSALIQARRYGKADGEVLGRLYRLLADVAWNAPVEYHQPIRHQLQRLHLTAAAQDFDEEQRRQLDGCGREVELALGGPRPLPCLTPVYGRSLSGPGGPCRVEG